MLQRVAYSIYWMSRYLQRADCYARLLAAQITLSKTKQAEIKQQWHQILFAMADDAFFYKKNKDANLENVLAYMTFDEENINSIANIIKAARNNASSIRETIYQETWELINIFYLKIQYFQANPHKNLAFYQLFFEEVCVFYAHFLAEIDKKIIKNEAILFIKLGAAIEHSDKVSRVLDLGFFNPTGIDLKINQAIFDSIISTSNYLQFNNTTDSIHYFILDESNEISLKNGLHKIERLIQEISLQSIDNQTIKLLESLRSFLSESNFESLSKTSLSSMIDEFQIKNNALDQAIFEQYFVFKPIHFGLNIGEQ